MGVWQTRRSDCLRWEARKREVAARNMQPPAGIQKGFHTQQIVKLRYGHKPLGAIIELKPGYAKVKWPKSTSWVRLDSLT